MNLQFSIFASYPRDKPSRLCEIQTHPAKDLLETHGQRSPPDQHIDDWDNIYEEAAIALNPFEVLDLDPLLADLSPDATGILSELVWSVVFATHNLLDHLSIGSADKPEV